MQQRFLNCLCQAPALLSGQALGNLIILIEDVGVCMAGGQGSVKCSEKQGAGPVPESVKC
jgi:hypothetical protein